MPSLKEPVTETCLCDNAVLHRKSVPTEVAMVNLPCPDIAFHKLVAKWTLVIKDPFLIGGLAAEGLVEILKARNALAWLALTCSDRT